MSDTPPIASETVTVTATLSYRMDDIAETEMEVTIATRRMTEIYDDGRQAVSPIGEFTFNGHDFTADRLRTLNGRRGPVSIEGYVSVPDGMEINVQPETSIGAPRMKVRVDGEEYEPIKHATRRVNSHLDDVREGIRSDLDPSITVAEEWEEGHGEGHAQHARSTITSTDGRTLTIHYRNAVDIGFQVFLDDGEEDFDEEEVDMLVDFARDNAPISRRMRM